MLQIAELKNKVSSVLNELKKNGRINDDGILKFNKQFEEKELRIGVVGKMKAGKSSLINAIVFGEDVLPTGISTTTVTLTEITYGKKEIVEVNLMSKQDIDELKIKANYSGEDASSLSEAQSAQEILDKLGSDYEKFLGEESVKTINISDLKENLKEYVAVGGKLCGLAKSVKIVLNNDNLKGITIIDTPGFNDPITSRCQTTENALKDCHILLFVHNDDGYDESDKDLLITQIEHAGISEIVDIFNKIDMSECPIRKWNEVLEEHIQKRNKMGITKNNENVKALLENAHSFYVSSLMALCGTIPFEKMDEEWKERKGMLEEQFEELCQCSDENSQREAFVRYSNLHAIINEINRLSKDGSKYIAEGPIMKLLGELSSAKIVVENDINEQKAQKEGLNTSIKANQETLNNFGNFMDEVLSKAKSSSIEIKLTDLISKATQDIQKLRETKSCEEFVEDHYSDPGFGSRKVTKRNVTNYNIFLSTFENEFRNRLYKLKDEFKNTSEEEIYSLIEDLSGNAAITQSHLNILKGSLAQSILNNIARIKISIETRIISEMPDGNQKQFGKLKSKFLCDYNDEHVIAQFMSFKQVVTDLNYTLTVGVKLDELRAKIEEIMKKSPEKKKKELDEIEETIQKLEQELGWIDGEINSINKLKKEL